MSDLRNKMLVLPIPIPSPCCKGRDNLAWGRMYGARVYLCRNCLGFVERKDALPLIRIARREFKAVYKDTLIRMTETMTYPKTRQGDTITWTDFFKNDDRALLEGK